ncbi:MAG TPA: MerR family transcriptional regulator [Nitrolancea sp.]|jgi:MerR family transcriptional regulator/heat shock protein HspR|nr:MerR family transcriptional regulator [Nitrolancea sp.]
MRENEPLYVISVAARLLELHPQTLRKYEREGFVSPSRTTGNLRLYSSEDLERLRQVKYLVEDRGINLAGVQLSMELTARVKRIFGEVAAISKRNDGALDPVLRDLAVVLEKLGIEMS